MALRSIPGDRLPTHRWVEDLRYSIDVFDAHDNLVEILGKLADIDVAKVAYRAAIIKYPNKRIFIRERARVIARSDEP